MTTTDWPTAELALARERVRELERSLDVSNDRNHWLALSLAKLCQYLDKHGGYMSAGNQRALREAKSLLAEHSPTSGEPTEGATQ